MRSLCLLLSLYLFLVVGCGGGGGSGGSDGPLAATSTPAGAVGSDPTVSDGTATFEGGTLYTGGPIPVVMLKGTWRAMGRQYGALCKQQMANFYNLAAGDTGRNAAQMADSAETTFQNYPSYFKELIQGMAETSGFSLERQKVIASLPNQLFFPGACSTLTAWGTYTGVGRPLVIGRNMDWGRNFPLYMPYIVAVVFNPQGGSTSVVDVGFVGGIFPMTDMNSHGVIVYHNAGWLSDPRTAAGRSPRSGFDILLNATSVAEAENAFLTRPASRPGPISRPLPTHTGPMFWRDR